MKTRLGQYVRQTLLCALLIVAVQLAPIRSDAAPYADIVIDARTGEVLHEENADARLHPASLTKMMTLYVAFEAIKRGEITLDTQVRISRNAANEPPSKLGLRAGQTIALRYLIRGAAVKSANDAATAIGEAIGGSEAAFAERMNRTARAMGMTKTTFKNMNGLTREGHLSSARDMATLGRRLFYDHPEYYNLFSRRSTDAGIATVRNTNRRFLDAYPGADGIKTGFTNAAGFNLVASAQHGNERIIAAVFGGRSTAWRNAKMAELLDLGFRKAPTSAPVRKPANPVYAAPLVADNGADRAASRVIAKSIRPEQRPTAPAAAPPAELLAALQDGIETALGDVEEATQVREAARIAAADIAPIPPAPRPVEDAFATPPTQPKPVPAPGEGAAASVEIARAAATAETGATPQDVVALANVTPVDATDPAPLIQSAPPPRPTTAGLVAQTPTRLARAEPPVPTVTPAQRPADREVVSRLSTSGGRYWAINLGRFPSRFHAEGALLKTALAESRSLSEGLRKVVPRSGGFDAQFAGLTRDQADLACRRLHARNQTCFTVSP